VLASRETPVMRQIAVNETAPSGAGPRQVVVVSYNVAKAFAHRGGLEFESPARVTSRLDNLATNISLAQPDIVCLSEVMTEAGTMPVDQVEYLAKACRLPYIAFGENYNLGVPGYRVVGGNAILSRTPRTPVANISLAGRRPFFLTSNSRRALFAEATLHGQTVLIGSIHNDSVDAANNDAQMKQILDFLGDQTCILAGDFNATPDTPTMKSKHDVNRTAREIAGRPTFPAHAPDRRIDYAFAPAEWEHVGTTVIPTTASDHRPMLAVFQVPEKK